MKRIPAVVCLLLFLASAVFAAPIVDQNIPSLPRTLLNARYVYVASYDGDQFSPNLLPDDIRAIAAVQNAIEKSGRFIVVYQPDKADIVLMVQSRPSEDVLAVYDAKGWSRNEYLWRVMGHSGLQESETPLVTQFAQAFEKMAK